MLAFGGFEDYGFWGFGGFEVGVLGSFEAALTVSLLFFGGSWGSGRELPRPTAATAHSLSPNIPPSCNLSPARASLHGGDAITDFFGLKRHLRRRVVSK